MELKVIFKFDAAHHLADYKGDCSRLHGHSWKVEVVLAGDQRDAVNSMLLDFKDIKKEIKDILPDHQYINILYDENNPTAEFLSCKFFNLINNIINAKKEWPVHLKSVEVWESDSASAKVVNKYV